MNRLAFEKQVQVASALVDGLSIRGAERLLGVHRDTIMRFGVTAGDACSRLHDALVRDVRASLIQADELWTFVNKKQRHLSYKDPEEFGDQYVFLAMDSVAKLIISYRTGKRTWETTDAFVRDLRQRVLGRPQLSTDAWNCYPDAVDRHFGYEVDYGTVDKDYAAPQAKDAARRYSPARLLKQTKQVVSGDPDWQYISTSHVERLNLSVRVSLKRFARLTIAHSKRVRNLEAAVSLFVSHFNFVRIHETLRCTPAMQLGLADHVWSMAELLGRALYNPPTPVGPLPPTQDQPPVAEGLSRRQAGMMVESMRKRRLRVIKGGKSR